MENKIDTSFFDILIQHIIKIIDKQGNEISFSKLEFKLEKRKYSSSVSPILYIDNVPCNCNEMKTYRILFKCRCGREINILLQKYMYKTNLWCVHCLQDPSFENRIHANKKGVKAKEKIDKRNITLSYNDMDENFKNHYLENHLTEEEFYKYLPYVYSINDNVINDNIKNIKYLFAYPTNNQLKFSPKISFDNGITYNSIKSYKLKCNSCGKIFNIHIQNIRNKNLDNIQCKHCCLTNFTFPIMKYKNTSITYQSKLEEYFLDKCFENNILVTNGFEIPYEFNGLKTYISDFYLPKYNIILELKGRNHFYRKDLVSGKIEAKNKAAIKFANENNMKFEFMLDKDVDNFISTLLNE